MQGLKPMLALSHFSCSWLLRGKATQQNWSWEISEIILVDPPRKYLVLVLFIVPTGTLFISQSISSFTNDDAIILTTNYCVSNVTLSVVNIILIDPRNCHCFHFSSCGDGVLLLVKPSRTLWSSWLWKHFCVCCFSFVRNRLQPAWPSLSFKGQV